MYFKHQNKPLGYFFIVLGLTILLLAAGELVFRILIALGALMLISHGMQLAGMPSAQQWAMRAYFSRFR